MRSVHAHLRTGRGYQISVAAGLPTAWRERPVVVLCHGLGVSSAYPLLATIRTTLLKTRYAVVQFDFAAHGKSGGGIQDRLVGNFVKDLDTVLDWLSAHGIVSKKGVIVLGHSIGALVALIYASRFPSRLRGIVLVAANARARLKFNQLHSQGRLKFKKTYWVVGHSKVARTFWSERNRFEPRSLVGRIQAPVLLLCGRKDVTNPPEESKLLYRWLHSPKRLRLIPMANHYFRQPISQRRVAVATRSWLRSIL